MSTRQGLARRYAIVVSVALAVLACDQTAKYLVVRDLTILFPWTGTTSLSARLRLFYGEKHIEHLARPPQTVIPGVWQDRYVENPGAAFNLLEHVRPGVRIVFFSVVILLAVAFIATMVARFPPERWGAFVALGGVLGGALGNFVDRMTRGYVIDFIDWHLGASPRLHWPTFNLADVGISLGALVLLFQVTREALRRDA